MKLLSDNNVNDDNNVQWMIERNVIIGDYNEQHDVEIIINNQSYH